MDFEELANKANVKEFVAIAGGMVASNFVRDFVTKRLPDVDPLLRDAGVALGALGLTYFINEQAVKSPERAELLGLIGLATTTLGAVPVANRVTIQVAKATSKPIVVEKNVRVSRGVDVSPMAVEKKKPVGGVSVGR